MPKSPDWKRTHPGYRFLRVTLGPTSHFVGRIEKKGTANVPLEGAAILAVNHLSYADPVILGAALPRPLYFLGKSGAFKNPLIGAWFRAMGQIPVDRAAGHNDDAVTAILAHLANQRVVGIFPEGTRSRPGRVRRGKTGVARLAALSGVPVIPIGLDTGDFWPMHATLPRLGAKIYVNVGEPMPLSLAPSDAEDKQKMRDATDDIMERVKALLDEAVTAREEGVRWR